MYGGVEAVGITSSATNVFTGTAVPTSEGHQSRIRPDGSTLDPSGAYNNNYYPYPGLQMTTRTWNGKVFYCGTHDCDWNRDVDPGGDYYKHKRDSCVGYIGHTSTSSTFDVEWTGSALGCTTTFGLIPNDPDFGYLTIAKASSNSSTQKDGVCPELYSLKGAEFTVKCVSSDYLKSGVTVGTFECKKDKGGTCEVTSGATKGDSDTVMALPPGKYNIIETAAPKRGYLSQVGATVSTVTIKDGETTKLTGDDAIENVPLSRLSLKKVSTVASTTQTPLCDEFYSLEGAAFKVTFSSAPSKEADGKSLVNSIISSGTDVGTFKCNDPEGGTCEVTGATYGMNDDKTVMLVPPGTYKVTETAAPAKGYASQVDKVVTVYVGDDGAEAVDCTSPGKRVTGTVKNKPLARVVVEKLSNEKDNWSYNLATYSRAGAQYQILNGSGAQVADGGPANNSTLTTRYEQVVADGTSGSVIAGDGQYVLVNPTGNEREAVTGRVRSNVMMVEDGSYTLHETLASEGYSLDSDRAFTAEAGELTVVRSWEPPVEDPISIYKQDATYRALSASNVNPLCRQYLSDATNLLTRQRKQQIPQGDASLDGAQYRVLYYDGYYTSASAAASSGALQRTWTMKTATDAMYGQGYAHMDQQHVSGNALYYNYENSSTYKEATVPLGTIVVTEVRASDGYTLKNADLNDVYTYVVQVRKINDTTTTANFVGQNYTSGTLDLNMNSRGELDSYNVVQRSDAWALKGDWGWRVMQEGYDLGHEWDMIYDRRVAPTNPNPTSTVAGATFEFYNRSTYPVISPTDGKTIVPSGGSSTSFERDRYTYHEDEDMVRVCIREWRELNAASDVAQRVCAIVTDDLG